MKIKYLGPRDAINVAGYGPHARDKIKDYPKEVGAELLATSERQKFEEVPASAKATAGKKTAGKK